MKTKITLFLLLALCSFSKAQNLLWSKASNGNHTALILAMHVCSDPFNNVYTTGYFSDSVDFDPGPGVFYLYNSGNASAFVSKLDPNGNFLWAVALAFSSNGKYELATDPIGNVYVHGFFGGITDFDPGPGTYTLSSSGNAYNEFLWKLSPNGTFIWAKAFPPNQMISTFKQDNSGSLYLVGSFMGTCDLDPGPAVVQLNSFGSRDGYVAKFDASGNFVNVKQIGGSNAYSNLEAVFIDGFSNLHAVGSFSGSIDADPGTSVSMLNANTMSKFSLNLTSAGNFSTALAFLPPTGSASILATTFDNTGNICLAGSFSGSSDFDPSAASYTLQGNPNGAFVSKLDLNANFLWARAIGLNTITIPNGCVSVKVDGGNNLFLTTFRNSSIDIDPGPGVFNLPSTLTNSITSFLSILDPAGIFISGFDLRDELDIGIAPDRSVYCNSFLGYPQVMTVNKIGTILTGIKEEVQKLNTLRIFPNPGNGLYQLSVAATENKVLEVYNTLGQKVMEQNIDSETAIIDLRNSGDGMYVIRLLDKGVLAGQSKVIKN